MSPYSSCYIYSEACPPAAIVYGYIPNLGANAFFDAWFGLALLAQTALLVYPPRINGARTRHWTFGALTILGTIMNFLGSLGRIWLEGIGWFHPAIGVELVFNLVGPALLICAIYCVLGRWMRYFGTERSRFSFKALAISFTAANALAISLQIIGGGVATSKGPARDSPVGSPGIYVALVGVIVQVVTMLVAAWLVFQYTRAPYQRQAQLSDEAVEPKNPARNDSDPKNNVPSCQQGRVGRLFVSCITLAFICVLIRSIYRIAEFAGGWGNPVMRNEPSYMVLDTALIAIAWTSVTIAHPSFMVTQMRTW